MPKYYLTLVRKTYERCRVAVDAEDEALAMEIAYSGASHLSEDVWDYDEEEFDVVSCQEITDA